MAAEVPAKACPLCGRAFDRALACADCGAGFVVTSGQVEYYKQRGLVLPRRCLDCRARRRAAGVTVPDPGPTGP